MDSAGTVEVGGPAGCLHGDFGRDLTNASGQAQHSLAQGGSCWYSEHLLWGDSLYLDSWVVTDIHFIFNVSPPPFAFSVIIVGLWRMLSTVCQGWGNVQSSNNASVLCSVKWWKRLVITGIIKPVRGSSMDGFVYCLLLWQHHKLLGLHFLRPGLRLQKIFASVSVCAYLTAQGSGHRLISCLWDVP